MTDKYADTPTHKLAAMADERDPVFYMNLCKAEGVSDLKRLLSESRKTLGRTGAAEADPEPIAWRRSERRPVDAGRQQQEGARRPRRRIDREAPAKERTRGWQRGQGATCPPSFSVVF